MGFFFVYNLWNELNYISIRDAILLFYQVTTQVYA